MWVGGSAPFASNISKQLAASIYFLTVFTEYDVELLLMVLIAYVFLARWRAFWSG
jgi:hypothetical protein